MTQIKVFTYQELVEETQTLDNVAVTQNKMDMRLVLISLLSALVGALRVFDHSVHECMDKS